MTNQEKLELYTVIRNIRHRYALDRMESGYLGTILPMVDQAKSEIRNELENRFDVDRWEDRRNAQLLAELERLSQGVKEQVGGQVEESSARAFEKSAEAQSSIYTLEGRAANVAMLQLSQEQIRSFVDTPVGGRTLQEWVSRSFDQPLIDKLKEEMGAGVFRGESYRKLADRIDELMDEARVNVEALTRSWVQDANVRAQKQMLDNNRDIVRGWRWNAILENSSYTKGHGTCLRCMALDASDEVYPLDGGPRIPLHVNCRCVRDTVTRSWEELGVSREGLDEAVNSLREDRPFSMRGQIDPVTGQFARGKVGVGGVPLIEAGTLKGGYSEFFEQMPDHMKRTSLGARRYEMWQRGEIGLDELADANGRQRTLAELQQLRRGGGGVGSSGTGAMARSYDVEAMSLSELDDFIRRNAGVETIKLSDFSEDKQRSILKGVADVVGNSAQFSAIKSSGRMKKAFGQYDLDGKLEISKQLADDAKIQDIKTRIPRYLSEKEDRINNLSAQLAKTKSAKKAEKLNDEITKLRAAERFAVYESATDPLEAIARHESWHAVYFRNKLVHKYAERLKANNVKVEDMFAVSEYGGQALEELFAETGAAMDSGVEIPENIKKAFMDTLRDGGLK